VLKLLDKNHSGITPLIVSGLGVVRDTSNPPGFMFLGTDFLVTKEAPYLRDNRRVIYDSDIKDLREAKEGEQGICILTPNSQSGLCEIYRDSYENLNARSDDLLGSGMIGRIQLLQRPQDAKNLEAQIA